MHDPEQAPLPSSPRTLACARCGTVFECRPAGGCWCAAEPYRLALTAGRGRGGGRGPARPPPPHPGARTRPANPESRSGLGDWLWIPGPAQKRRPGMTKGTTPPSFVYRERPHARGAFTREPSMIDLYALTSPNVQKIFIMLEECELPYNTKLVDVWKGDQFSPEFSKINPLQKIPAIVDSDGPGGVPYTVIESGAILLYLAEKTGKFIPHDPVRRYDTLQWLMVQVANVGPICGQLAHFSKYAPA